MATTEMVTMRESEHEKLKGYKALVEELKGYEGKAKAGRKGEAVVFGLKSHEPVLQSVFTGAAVYWLATSDWFDGIDVFKDNWFLKPLIVLGLGYWLFKKGSPFGTALLTAGAVLFMQGWKTRPKGEKKGKKQDATAEGVDEAGRYDWSADTYGAGGEWAPTPSGGRSYMTQGNGSRAPERIASRVFEYAAR